MAINNEAFFYKLVYVTSTYYTHRETPVNDVPSNYLCAILNSVFTSRIDVRLPFSACVCVNHVTLLTTMQKSICIRKKMFRFCFHPTKCNIRMNAI